MRRRILLRTHLTADYPELFDAFRDRHPELTIVESTEDQITSDLLSGVEILVAPPVSEELLKKAESLKLHVIPFAGVNRAPLDWYRRNHVILASSHGNASAVAERSVALAMAAAGRLVEFDQDLRRGLWHRNRSAAQPFDFWRSLRGATTTVLGAGAIGQECAHLLRPLVGTMTAFRRSSTSETPEPFDSVTTDLNRACDGAQLLIAALPLTPETSELLGREQFELARGAVFVNVSRAEIVAEEVLFSALRDGLLSAAGLDVWYRYPDPFWATTLPSEFPFHELPQVVLSPHAGSHAEEGKRGQFEGAVALLEEYLGRGTVSRPIDLGRGY